MKPDGGKAFPVVGAYTWDANALINFGGMTLRDYFAAAALSVTKDSMVRHGTPTDQRGLAAGAYLIADAMLAERAKP